MVDAVVVGSGPNGLAAAIELARKGLRVRVHEAEPTIGGGARSAQSTLPGFLHDICSAIHPMAAASPFFRGLLLARFGWRAALPSSRLPFRGVRARALMAGAAAHSFLPLDAPFSGSFALILSIAAHAVGWPVARGGSQRIADSLAATLRGLGGE